MNKDLEITMRHFFFHFYTKLKRVLFDDFSNQNLIFRRRSKPINYLRSGQCNVHRSDSTAGSRHRYPAFSGEREVQADGFRLAAGIAP